MVRLSRSTAAPSPRARPSKTATISVSFVRGKTADVGSAGASIWLSFIEGTSICRSLTRRFSASTSAATLSWASRGLVQREWILMIPVPLNVSTEIGQSPRPRIPRAR